uniref:Uncharacterized protein n=1 Tax=Arundo donax TaxID=35708 RepID=A0A0A8ZHQ9_ARUDO
MGGGKASNEHKTRRTHRTTDPSAVTPLATASKEVLLRNLCRRRGGSHGCLAVHGIFHKPDELEMRWCGRAVGRFPIPWLCSCFFEIKDRNLINPSVVN